MHIYCHSGEFIQTVSNDRYFDLALLNDKLYATHLDLPTIHIYACGTWNRMYSISTPCSKTKHVQNAHWHRICVNTDEIKLSCFDLDSIYILETHGKFDQSYGPTITIIKSSRSESIGEPISEPSDLKQPIICQEDDDGALLVADRWNNRILILTAEGKWRQVRHNDWLWGPRDAVLWGGRLYVSTRLDNRLAMFK